MGGLDTRRKSGYAMLKDFGDENEIPDDSHNATKNKVG